MKTVMHYLADYAASGLVFTGMLTGALAIAAVVSTVRL